MRQLVHHQYPRLLQECKVCFLYYDYKGYILFKYVSYLCVPSFFCVKVLVFLVVIISFLCFILFILRYSGGGCSCLFTWIIAWAITTFHFFYPAGSIAVILVLAFSTQHVVLVEVRDTSLCDISRYQEGRALMVFWSFCCEKAVPQTDSVMAFYLLYYFPKYLAKARVFPGIFVFLCVLCVCLSPQAT